MVPMFRRWFQTLLAVGPLLLSGCFGVSHNPSYFPHLLPPGDIIQTHAKPPGPGYFSNFDPHACRIEVRPLESTNPVRTQHVLIATVLDENGLARRSRRVEWMLEGAGNIIEVDESGFFPGRGYKVNNQYAVSYTDYGEHRISRNNGNPNDDIIIKPGQSWCVISSAIEGDSYVTVYAPEIANWDAHKVFVTQHWVDAEWVFPKPAVNRAGTQHVFTTNIFRHTDHQPLANYKVRYRILDGPPAFFLPGQGQEAVVVSDLNGNANVTLAQVAPAMGINRIGIEIIRPPDPNVPSGSGIVIGRGETTKEWQAPQVVLTKTGPPTAAVNQDIPYTITVSNNGQVPSHALTVRDRIPESLTFVSSQPPAMREGTDLIWTLGELPGGQSRTIQVVFHSTQPGIVRNTASVVTDEGLKDEKTAQTEIVIPGLRVTKTGPPTGTVGMPIEYQITVTNPGTGPATNVTLKDQFDAGLEHESKVNTVQLTVGTLAPLQSKTVKLSLTPKQAGRLVNRVTALADGGLSATAEHAVEVRQAQIMLKQSGPQARYVGRPAEWSIQVTNPGDVPLNNVVVRDLLPAEVTFQSASNGGQLKDGQIVWNLGSLQPKEQKVVQVTAKATKLAQQAINLAVASAEPGLEAQDKAAIQIRGLPAFRLEVYDLDDPVEVNGKTSYKIEVTNQGSLPGNQVQITAIVPPEMKVLNANGPSTPKIDGQTITFPPVNELDPGQTLSYTVEVQALKTGDVRFRAELRSATLSAPVIEEESTNIYAVPAGMSQPAPSSPAASAQPMTTPAAAPIVVTPVEPPAPPPSGPPAPTTPPAPAPSEPPPTVPPPDAVPPPAPPPSAPAPTGPPPPIPPG
jgi:uncharacterized repeat protein (TIGR01451 family)